MMLIRGLISALIDHLSRYGSPRAFCYPRSLAKPAPTPRPAFIWLTAVLLTLAGILLIGLFSTELGDTDSWWHLASGRYIAQNHRLPVPDPFAYTTAGAVDAHPGEADTRHFNLTHEWLAQLVMYGFYALAGYGGVVLWKALILTLLCGATGWIAARRTGSMLWGLAAAGGTAALAIEFAHDRPALLSYAFVAVFLSICERGRRLWLLPVLSLVWANCHGGYFLGWIVVGAYAAEALVRRQADARRWIAMALATVVVSGVNPNGFGAIIAILRYRQSPMQSTLIEWSRPSFWGSPYAFDVLLYLMLATLAISWRRVRVADWLLAAAFAAASLIAFRNTPLVGVLAPILVANYFPWKRALPGFARWLAAAGLVAGIAWGVETGRFFQFRAAEWRFPGGAVQFLRDRHIDGRVFNTYEHGGYLIWQGVPVFIDGRALSENVFSDYTRILALPAGDDGRRALLDRYQIRTVVANAFEYNGGTLYPVVLAMQPQTGSGWHLVFEDAQALVFVRELPPGVAELPAVRLGEHLERECRLHVENDPEFSLCARTLADVYLRGGDRNRARQWLRYYLDHPYGEDPAAVRAWEQNFAH
jgi:hypothetical protein